MTLPLNFSAPFFRGAEFLYVYDGDGNIVRFIDISVKKEYTYTYEEGRIVRATEFDITLNDNGYIIFNCLSTFNICNFLSNVI